MRFAELRNGHNRRYVWCFLMLLHICPRVVIDNGCSLASCDSGFQGENRNIFAAGLNR